jgi:ubiquinone/menaquinone biosynthesis C-methylase UbiE
MPSQDNPSPREFFSVHAEDYAKSDSHAHGSDLSELVELLDPKPSEVALDVGAGTGFTTVEIARRVKRAVALDMTEEMLAQARKLAGEKGLANIMFEIGDAERLPFPDSSFSIVTTRRAAHHFSSVDDFLKETCRVLVNGGRVGIVDMSPPEGAQDFFNDLERLRDSSHTSALTPSEWRDKVKRAGLEVVMHKVLSEPRTIEQWLYPVKMGGREESMIRERLLKAPASVASLLRFTYDKGEITGFTKDRILLIAMKNHS